MDDEWLDYYSNLENLEDYSSRNENKNPDLDFVKRKFNYWKKYYEEMKNKDENEWKFFFKKNIEPDILAFDNLCSEEKKLITN